MNLCSYGCGKEGIYQFKNGKFCCSNNISKCDATKNKIRYHSKQYIGEKNPMFGKHHSLESKVKIGLKSKQKIYSKEYREKLRITSTGRKQSKEQIEKSKQRMLNWLANYMRSFIKPESHQKQRERMLNGGSIKALKGMKNPSKQELILRELVKELYPLCEFQYPILNYSIDVALPEHKIAIEYDGYYHFDTEEHKEYHKRRQEQIEKEGWKFLRYTMFNKFPVKEQVKDDIQKLMNLV